MSQRTEVRNELRERVLAILNNGTGQPLCARCLSGRVEAPHKVVHEAGLKIEAMADYLRAYGTCAECGKMRVVIGRRS
jgi:hypothetical protein